MSTEPEFLPAIPPDDYKGSQADWMTELQTRGLWNSEGWHGDVDIPFETWWEILEACEGEDSDDNDKGIWIPLNEF